MRIVSGIQPTGELHIGNYFGALRHWVALQSEGECFFMLADLHAITTPQNPAELRERIVNTAALLLAIGIDPARSVFLLHYRRSPGRAANSFQPIDPPGYAVAGAKPKL
jgi:tryptophanyl-tRNA synthetase